MLPGVFFKKHSYLLDSGKEWVILKLLPRVFPNYIQQITVTLPSHYSLLLRLRSPWSNSEGILAEHCQNFFFNMNLYVTVAFNYEHTNTYNISPSCSQN